MFSTSRTVTIASLFAIISGLVLVACGGDVVESESQDAGSDSGVMVADVWSRPTLLLDGDTEDGQHEHDGDDAMDSTGTNGVVYMTVENEGEDGDWLLSASSDVAEVVELHTVNMVDDVAQMRQVEDGVELPAGETVRFEPAGLHVMLVNLNQSIEAGDKFDLSLTFEAAGTMTVEVEVRDQT